MKCIDFTMNIYIPIRYWKILQKKSIFLANHPSIGFKGTRVVAPLQFYAFLLLCMKCRTCPDTQKIVWVLCRIFGEKLISPLFGVP